MQVPALTFHADTARLLRHSVIAPDLPDSCDSADAGGKLLRGDRLGLQLFPAAAVNEYGSFQIQRDPCLLKRKIQTKTFTDVPMRNGYKTIYHGQFFTDQDASAVFTVDDWNEYDAVTF